MTTTTALEIRRIGRVFSIYAGTARMGRTFRTRAIAQAWIEDNAAFVTRWADAEAQA
jgi:hypothetical protein